MFFKNFSKFIMVVFLTGFVVSSLASNYSVEELTIKKSHSNAWALAGKIRNKEKSPVKGYVKIKFLDHNGYITKSAKAFVNDNDSIEPGQAAPFEYWTNPEDFNGVKNFQVIFVER